MKLIHSIDVPFLGVKNGFYINITYQHPINPPPCNNRIETTDNNMETFKTNKKKIK